MTAPPPLYVQTNDAEMNEVLALERTEHGALASMARFPTGGRGSGEPHFPSQGSIVLSEDGGVVLVVNAGSDDVSMFAVEPGALTLTDRASSGGSQPVSVAVAGDLVYVLNNATPNVVGYRISNERLLRIDGSARPLSGAYADPAQVAFSPDGATLAVTERGTDSISTFAVDGSGLVSGPRTIPSSGRTPYGFAFTRQGAMVVTEAFGGAVGEAAAASYRLTEPGRVEPVSGSVPNTRSEVCWAAVTPDGHYAFVTNFGDGTVSSYTVGRDGSLELHAAVAATTRLGRKGIRDEAITADGRYLYAIDADAREVLGWTIDDNGGLTAIGVFPGLPATMAGLAAS